MTLFYEKIGGDGKAEEGPRGVVVLEGGGGWNNRPEGNHKQEWGSHETRQEDTCSASLTSSFIQSFHFAPWAG